MTDAIVLGGSAGVGRAIVDALLARGMTVGVVARDETRLRALSDALGERVRTASADVGDAEALGRAVATLCPAGDTPHIWVNCAMATTFGKFEDVDPEAFDKIVRTTFLGQVNGTRLALKHMKGGNIVHVGSGLAYRPVPGQAAYVAAKHAINGFVGALRSELINDRPELCLSLVQLPAMNTTQFDWARNKLSMRPQPAPPVYAPEVAARAVMKAIDGNIREVFVGSSVLKLIFGDMLLPGYIDRRMAESGIPMQKSDRPEPGGRPDNLFEPVDHAPSATGDFEGEVSDHGIAVDADKARIGIMAGIVAASIGLGIILGGGTARAAERPDRRRLR